MKEFPAAEANRSSADIFEAAAVAAVTITERRKRHG